MSLRSLAACDLRHPLMPQRYDEHKNLLTTRNV